MLISTDKNYVEIPIGLLDPILYSGVRAALVGWPVPRNVNGALWADNADFPVCYFLSKKDKPPIDWDMLAAAQITTPQSRPISGRVERIVCFRQFSNDEARQEWERAYLSYEV